jgi:transglutaminase-like putative cysteine protease
VRDTALLDHRQLDLEGADRLTYVLEQTFRYDYDTPVQALRQRLVALPRPRHGDQHRRTAELEVVGADTVRRTLRDRHGNEVIQLRADRVEQSVEFRISATLERVRGDGPAMLPVASLSDRRLLGPTALTAPDERIRDFAHSLDQRSDTPLERGERICVAVFEAIKYEYGVTGVRTCAAEALAGGVGVCQDSAHVMVAICHVLALPARYVSGHLLGQGGTHAWVEVLVAAEGTAVAIAFDPCNGHRANSKYVTVATGRDYRDVAPTSGSFVGRTHNRLTTTRRVGIVAAA